MTGFEAGEEPSDFVRSITTLIDRRAAKYAEELGPPAAADPRRRPRTAPWPNERDLLERFESTALRLIARYEPPGIRRHGDSLVFRHVYAHARPAREVRASRGEVPLDLIAGLLAAEVEFRGPLRLSHTQNGLLADIYEDLGRALVAAGLPAHAALAFRRALFLHRTNGSPEAEDRCGLAERQAKWRASPPGWRRPLRRLPDLVCGYGYRPFRMLGLIGLQLLFFTGMVTWVTDTPVTQNLYLCLTNYLNPLGLSDSAGSARPIYVVEAYLGTISMSVFFALLVRRWFRL